MNYLYRWSCRLSHEKFLFLKINFWDKLKTGISVIIQLSAFETQWNPRVIAA